MQSMTLEPSSPHDFLIVSTLSNLWHQRLGHSAFSIVSCVMSFFHITVDKDHMHRLCVSYQLGKICQSPFPLTMNKSIAPFNLIHTDIWGPSPISSHSGYSYYIHFIDDYSKCSWFFGLKSRSELPNKFSDFSTSCGKFA